MSSGVRTFVFTDLVGSASLTSRLGDEAADVVRRMHFSLLRDAVAATGGREVKNLGDGLMVTFSDAADALDCAAAMQQATHRHNTRPGAEPLGLRVGAHVGPAIPDGADFFGITVTAAKRLCDRAASGQVLVSDDVRELAGARTQHELRSLGSIELKGLRAPVPSCEVRWQPVIPAPLALPPGLVAGRPAALVDRKRELEQMEDALRGAATGASCCCTGNPASASRAWWRRSGCGSTQGALVSCSGIATRTRDFPTNPSSRRSPTTFWPVRSTTFGWMPAVQPKVVERTGQNVVGERLDEGFVGKSRVRVAMPEQDTSAVDPQPDLRHQALKPRGSARRRSPAPRNASSICSSSRFRSTSAAGAPGDEPGATAGRGSRAGSALT